MKYHVPTKLYIYHAQLDPFLDDDSNYTSKQIAKKHFTSECPLQKTKYRKTNTEPNKFRSQIKLTNFEIRTKKSTSHELLDINKRIYKYTLDKSIRRQPK